MSRYRAVAHECAFPFAVGVHAGSRKVGRLCQSIGSRSGTLRESQYEHSTENYTALAAFNAHDESPVFLLCSRLADRGSIIARHAVTFADCTRRHDGEDRAALGPAQA